MLFTASEDEEETEKPANEEDEGKANEENKNEKKAGILYLMVESQHVHHDFYRVDRAFFVSFENK